MRISIFVLTSSVLLFLLTLQAFSQTTIGYDEISGTFNIGGGSVTQQAQAERAAMMGQPGKEILSEPFGSNSSSGTSTLQQSSSQRPNQSITTPPSVTKVTAPDQSETSSQLAVISGNWSLDLNDSTPHTAVLTIFQNGDAIYGTGNINLNSNTTLMAAASGIVTGNKIKLDIVSLGKVGLYRISMTINGNSAIGSYTAFSPGAASTTDTVNGVRAVPPS